MPAYLLGIDVGTTATKMILVNDSGMVEVQVANPVAGATYYVKVAAAQPQGSRSTGKFFLGIDFTAQPVVLNQKKVSFEVKPSW